MEKLTLACGRFIPTRGGDTAERVERLEAYLFKLTQELERLVTEMNSLTGSSAAMTNEGDTTLGREEGGL